MTVDYTLVHDAETLATGADIHETQMLLRMYKAAAEGDTPQDQEAAKKFEEGLRKHIAMLRRKRSGA